MEIIIVIIIIFFFFYLLSLIHYQRGSELKVEFAYDHYFKVKDELHKRIENWDGIGGATYISRLKKDLAEIEEFHYKYLKLQRIILKEWFIWKMVHMHSINTLWDLFMSSYYGSYILLPMMNLEWEEMGRFANKNSEDIKTMKKELDEWVGYYSKKTKNIKQSNHPVASKCISL